MIARKTTGIAMAIAAAGMFSMAPMTVVAESDAKVHCYGVNKCKGQNDCKTANNACKGKSACKGKGFLSMTKAECDKAGGKVGE
jgi:uncharacterized membrane protein